MYARLDPFALLEEVRQGFSKSSYFAATNAFPPHLSKQLTGKWQNTQNIWYNECW